MRMQSQEVVFDQPLQKGPSKNHNWTCIDPYFWPRYQNLGQIMFKVRKPDHAKIYYGLINAPPLDGDWPCYLNCHWTGVKWFN